MTCDSSAWCVLHRPPVRYDQHNLMCVQGGQCFFKSSILENGKEMPKSHTLLTFRSLFTSEVNRREEFRFYGGGRSSLSTSNCASSEPENHLPLEVDLRFMLGGMRRITKASQASLSTFIVQWQNWNPLF